MQAEAKQAKKKQKKQKKKTSISQQRGVQRMPLCASHPQFA
jgi:hypothetical protein